MRTLFLIFVLGHSFAFANELFRPQKVGVFSEGYLTSDEMVKVKGATVAWADYGALKRDFPELSGKTEAEIDRWTLDNFAYVSKQQLKLEGVRNTHINTELGKDRTGYRPSSYKRAAILEAGLPNGGLVDLKGVGLAGDDPRADFQKKRFDAGHDAHWKNNIRLQNHSDGLMSLGEAIAETTRQQAAQKLFDIRNSQTGSKLQTVESYFVISLPFEIYKEEEKKIPAAIYGRQAHFGRHTHLTVPRDIFLDVGGNFQRTSMAAAVDFGTVMITDPRLIKNFGMIDNWSISEDPQYSKPWAWGHETADAYFYRGAKSSVKDHVQTMLEPIQSEWLKVPHTTLDAGLSLYDRMAMLLKGQQDRQRIVGLFEAIPSIGEPWVMDLISLGLDDPTLIVKRMAVEALTTRKKDAATLKLIQKAYASTDDEIRGRSLHSLSKWSDNTEGMLDHLRKMGKRVTDGDSELGRYLPSTLGAMKDPQSEQFIMECLDSSHSSLQKIGAAALESRYFKNEEDGLVRAVLRKSIFKKAIWHSNEDVRKSASVALLRGHPSGVQEEVLQEVLSSKAYPYPEVVSHLKSKLKELMSANPCVAPGLKEFL